MTPYPGQRRPDEVFDKDDLRTLIAYLRNLYDEHELELRDRAKRLAAAYRKGGPLR